MQGRARCGHRLGSVRSSELSPPGIPEGRGCETPLSPGEGCCCSPEEAEEGKGTSLIVASQCTEGKAPQNKWSNAPGRAEPGRTQPVRRTVSPRCSLRRRGWTGSPGRRDRTGGQRRPRYRSAPGAQRGPIRPFPARADGEQLGEVLGFLSPNQSDPAGVLQGGEAFSRLLPPGEQRSPGKRGSPDGTVRGRSCAPNVAKARPERAGCEHRRILGGPVGRWRKPGRARGRLSRPFPVRMGFMSKQNRRARSEQKTPRSHPRLADPRREVFGAFPSISRRPGAGGASPPDGVWERTPQTQRGSQSREPPPSPPRGRADISSPAGGPVAVRALWGPHLPPLRPAPRQGEATGASPPRQRSRRDLSRPPLAGGAQSRPGPGLPRRPSRGPARTGAAVKSRSRSRRRHFPAGRSQGRTHGTRGGDRGDSGGGQPLSSRGSRWFGVFFLLPPP
ncbi:serine/arginine repetitive matrix protein 2-like [Molothrus aeneus]|uniref:serine/arginine repetitive matrix protein 2-like n=1 Tax=Molothrus aeneus TaxID=84833 RepID=UPI003457E50E